MKEKENILKILENTKKAIKDYNVVELKNLSNQTIHTASIYQDTDNISVAVIVYALGKIIQKKETEPDKNWNKVTSNFILFIEGAIKALKQDDLEKFRKQLGHLRREINKFSPNLRKQIKEVFRKASINKASKIYEHGISLEQTAKLLGLSIWEISEYAASKLETPKITATIKPKDRLKNAMEFFS
ncbi:MAG: hypothetical protein KKF56_00950 [Nanoarchaeota archaeon]|nr:hypothetical protein [Nanoarchaeota archaeon]